MEGCADDHPATIELRSGVAESIETRFPDVNALIDAGFKPYFDTLETGTTAGHTGSVRILSATMTF